MTSKNDFEFSMVKGLNTFFKENGPGKAYRLKQSRFQSQFLDILVDSPDRFFYMGLECKSINAAKYNKLYFLGYFSEAGGVHQLDRINTFLTESGRKGFLAVETRNGPGRNKEAFLLPFDWIYGQFKLGKNGVTIDEIKENGRKISRVKGLYQIKKGLFV